MRSLVKQTRSVVGLLKQRRLMALAKATVETEAVHKEDSETETDDGSSETKEVDMTAVAKTTAETEAVLKEDSAQERDSDGGSGKTKEVDLTRTEAVLKEDSAEETVTQIVGPVKQRKLI